jgi:molybdate transport system ATP-binding protein
MLEVTVRHRLGDFVLDANFASDGGLTALFGRSGSGKTSLINAIAGLIRPEHARIVVGDEVLTDTDRHIFVPRHRRRTACVFQEGRLFPHLTVRQNLLYGRWFTRSLHRHGDFTQIVDMLGIGHLLRRRPALLSGGEKQRVAIGRALLANPRLLMMDEPLASLDEDRKAEILPYIERLRDETRLPIVYVSHSIAEVARLASTLVILSEGRIATAGPAAEVMARLDLSPITGRPETGAIVETRIIDHDMAFGLTRLRAAAGELRVPRLDLPVGSKVRVRIRARDVMIAVREPKGLSALNVLPGIITEIGPSEGPIAELRLDCGGDALIARLTRQSIATLKLSQGRKVYAVIKSVAFDRRAVGRGSGMAKSADVGAVVAEDLFSGAIRGDHQLADAASTADLTATPRAG